MKWNKAYDDRVMKDRDFTPDLDAQLDLYYDDITDYHKCAQYGRSGYYRALYWTLSQMEHWNGNA